MNTIHNYNLDNSIKQIIFNNQDYVLCKRFLNELNAFRLTPQILLPYLQKRKLNYSLNEDKNILFSPNHPFKGLLTQQGQQPINQLIQRIQTQHNHHDKDNHNNNNNNIKQSLPPLQQNPTLSLMAQNIATTFIQVNKLSQIKLTQSKVKYLRQQLNSSKEYEFDDRITCLIGAGFDGDQYQPLMSLLVDDGDKRQRKNRNILMNFGQRFKFVGIGTVKLKLKQQLRVVVYLLTGNIRKKY